MVAKFTEVSGLTSQSLGEGEDKYSSIQRELEYWMVLSKFTGVIRKMKKPIHNGQ